MLLSVWPMTWTRPDALTSEPGGAPGFHSCCGQHKLNRIILRELLPSIDEYNEWLFCAVVTFSSHTSWISGAKNQPEISALQGSFHSRSIFTPQPLRAPGYCRRLSGRAGGRKGSQAPLTLPRPQFFTDYFQTWEEHLLPYDLGQVGSWRFCLIKYAHNGPFDQPASFDLPELIFQAKVTKFVTYR